MNFPRLSIPGYLCTHCGAEMGKPLRCPGCGWVDPPTRRSESQPPSPGAAGPADELERALRDALFYTHNGVSVFRWHDQRLREDEDVHLRGMVSSVADRLRAVLAEAQDADGEAKTLADLRAGWDEAQDIAQAALAQRDDARADRDRLRNLVGELLDNRPFGDWSEVWDRARTEVEGSDVQD